jgi:hypothetical protein
MFPDTEIGAGGRFLEFNGGDWFMMVGGFTLAGTFPLIVTHPGSVKAAGTPRNIAAISRFMCTLFTFLFSLTVLAMAARDGDAATVWGSDEV